MRTIKLTILNILIYIITLGKFIFLEGRVGKDGIVSNWNKNIKFKPDKRYKPKTLKELIDIVKTENKIRVIGAGHSFNFGIITECLVSLDDYKGVICLDLENNLIKVKGGTRVREISTYLWDLSPGYALEYLPSHDAQSIAGIISTDVHGTGEKVAFVSDQVLSLEIIDGNGDLHSFEKDSDGFNAVIGGIGTCGIIVSVTLRFIERFNVKKEIKIISVEECKRNLKRNIETVDHYRLIWNSYSGEFAEYKFNRTIESVSFLASFREFLFHFSITLYSGVLTELIKKDSRVIKFIQKILSPNSKIVLKSYDGFNQTLYHPHVEVEFTVEREKIWEIFDQIRKIFDSYNFKHFYALEFRFTHNHPIGFVSPGFGENEKVYIDVLINKHKENDVIYNEINRLIMDNNLKPHLGKFTIDIDSKYMKQCFEKNFDKMLDLQRVYDPRRKFMNKYCEKIFGP